MDGEYTPEWAVLRGLRRRILLTALAGVIPLLLTPVANLLPHRWSLASGLVLVVSWAVLLFRFFFLLFEHAYWPCPRCGKPFHYKTGFLGHYHNPFARRCVYCQLPKWAESDPDPKLKHELDPFRSDAVLKLGDVKHSPGR